MNQTKTRKLGRPVDLGLEKRRKSQILTISSKVFAQKGYNSCDVNDIAKKAKLSKGTIYNYFSNKESLFLASVDWLMTQLMTTVNDNVCPDSDPLSVIENAIKSYLAYFDKHPEFVELLIQERAIFKKRKKPTYFVYRDSNIKPWKDLYRKLIKDGRVRKISVDRIVDVISDLLYGTIFTNYFAGRTKSMKNQTSDILDIFFNGILSDSEKKERELK